MARDENDFACSYTYRSHYAYEMEGVILPDLEPEDDLEERMSLLEAKPPTPRRGELEQLRGRMNFLESKMMEQRAKKAIKGKIVIDE